MEKKISKSFDAPQFIKEKVGVVVWCGAMCCAVVWCAVLCCDVLSCFVLRGGGEIKTW